MLYTYGRLEVQFQFIRRRAPFDDPALRDQLRQKLHTIPSVDLPAEALDRRPSIPLATLVDDETLNQVLAVFDWAFAQSRTAAAAAGESQEGEG